MNLKTFPRLTRYLKQQTHQYVAKKSATFTPQQMETYLMICQTSSDPGYTLRGVISAMLYYGLMRCTEILYVEMQDVAQEEDGRVCVRFHHGRKRKNEGFTYWIPSRYRELFKRYIEEVRDDSDVSSRFLKNHNKAGSYRVQNCGRGSVNDTVKHVCTELALNDKKYTGHAFRRSAATNLADAGVGIVNLKRHGLWKSPAAAEGYIANSVPLRREREQKLLPESLRERSLDVINVEEYTKKITEGICKNI